MAFDRLVRAVDAWAGQRRRSDVFAQIGPSRYRPQHAAWARFLDPPEFRARAAAARVIVAHAGMGSILTALTLGKPILVMPRRGDLRETRNDHQVATARRFAELGRVAVAMNEDELAAALDRLDSLTAGEPIAPHADERLIAALRDFFASGQDMG